MKKILALAATALMAVSLAVPATIVPTTPVAAQSFSFGFNIGRDRIRRSDWCDFRPWDCRPRFRPRRGISIDIGNARIRFRGSLSRSHVARCEARFRSYDWRTDTYLGYDGDRHRCRL